MTLPSTYADRNCALARTLEVIGERWTLRRAGRGRYLLAGLLTLGSGPARFQTRAPACYRASWQLPGPDFHRQATTSLRKRRKHHGSTSRCHLLLFCWAHETSSVIVEVLYL